VTHLVRAALVLGVALAAAARAAAGQAAEDPRTVARVALRAALTPDDDRYLAFQMWQEGVARYTELLAARFAARHVTPSRDFRALPGFISFDTAASRIESGIHAGLRAPLNDRRRVAFYALGAGYALLRDEMEAGWRARYLEGEMTLDDR